MREKLESLTEVFSTLQDQVKESRDYFWDVWWAALDKVIPLEPSDFDEQRPISEVTAEKNENPVSEVTTEESEMTIPDVTEEEFEQYSPTVLKVRRTELNYRAKLGRFAY